LIRQVRSEENSARARSASQSEEELESLIEDLIKKLRADDRSVRVKAAHALGDLGARAKSAIPALLDNLGNDDDGVGNSAAVALAHIGNEATPRLILTLDLGNARERAKAAYALGYRVGGVKPSPDAVPALTEALKDDDAHVRMEAVHALAGIRDKTTIPALLALLKREQDADVRADVAGAFGSFGSEAEEAVPILIQVVVGGEVLLQNSAANSLSHIGQASVPALIEVLNDAGNGVAARESALMALRIMTERLEAAVPALVMAMADKEATIRRGAIDVLAVMGRRATMAVPWLILVTELDEEASVRARARNALALIVGQQK
jgi:HEAT repeat protein